jgi:hypothetical protein
MSKISDKKHLENLVYLARPDIAAAFDGHDASSVISEDYLFQSMRADGVLPEGVPGYEECVVEDYAPGLVDRYKAYLVANPPES